MTFWYNPPKDSKFASLNCSDWNQVNTKAEFKELRFCSNDDFYYVYAAASVFTGVQKIGEKDFTINDANNPQFITFKVARKDYQKWDSKEKKQAPTQQTRLEKWVCKILEELDDSKAYTGKIDLQDSGMLDIYLSGNDTKGDPIQPEFLKTMQATSVVLTEVEPKEIADEDLKVPEAKKSSFGSGFKGETELERLNARLSFLCQQMMLLDETLELKSMLDVSRLCDDPKYSKEGSSLLAFLLDFVK